MMRRVISLVAATALVLTGCSSDDGADDGATPTPPASDDDAGTDDDGTGTDDAGTDDDGTGTDDDAEADDGGASADRYGEVSIDQTQSHPNGVELTVQTLRVEQDAIFVDIEAFNGAPREILLAALDMATVTDDTGREFRYEPPEDNEALRIESNGTLEGSIAFVGRIGQDATSVTVRFNHQKNDGEPFQPADADNADFADAPSFEFADLPLPGADG